MNARVLLLVLVTGLFMTAWNGDQTAMQAAYARRDARQRAARIALKEAVDKETPTISSTVADTSHRLIPTNTPLQHTDEQSVGSNVALQVPMPAGIAVGEYQAVNQTGTTSRVSVTAAVATGKVQREFYTVDAVNGDRWYFIRIASTK